MARVGPEATAAGSIASMTMWGWESLWTWALNTLVPADCISCGTPLHTDPVPFLCRPCWQRIRPLHGPACPRCGRPFPSSIALLHSPDHLCGDCRRHRPAFTRAWSAYPYEPPLREAIRLFKYRRKVALAGALGQLWQSACPNLPDIDLIMPVPLHASRLREREFNQALLLADRLNRRFQLPLSHDNLVRVRETQPQTELTRRARRQNLRRAFGIQRPREIDGKRILLIDDVMTTGTTVNECAKALRRAGAGDVFVATLARTV